MLIIQHKIQLPKAFLSETTELLIKGKLSWNVHWMFLSKTSGRLEIQNGSFSKRFFFNVDQKCNNDHQVRKVSKRNIEELIKYLLKNHTTDWTHIFAAADVGFYFLGLRTLIKNPSGSSIASVWDKARPYWELDITGCKLSVNGRHQKCSIPHARRENGVDITDIWKEESRYCGRHLNILS